MSTDFKLFKFMLVGMSIAVALALSGPCSAFDIKGGVSKESGPFDLFKFGFKAYKNGQKEEAVEAYKYA
ncbi:sel1 repeat family protein, partial [Rhizobium johnstonii]